MILAKNMTLNQMYSWLFDPNSRFLAITMDLVFIDHRKS